MGDHAEHLFKELYLVETEVVANPLENNGKSTKIEFVGAFKSSQDAKNHTDYMVRLTNHVSYPAVLDESFVTYFDKFRYCFACDKYPYDLPEKSAVLIEEEHDGKYHFKCILPTMKEASVYLKGSTGYRAVQLKLCYPRDTFFHDMYERRQRNARWEEEKKYKLAKEKEKKKELSKESNAILKFLLMLNLIQTLLLLYFK